jgi:membrane protein YqaA with SNARE-associated domain
MCWPRPGRPDFGLLISLVSATLVPLGSEPAVFAVIKANPAMFWSAILVATIGNTLGGVIDYWMGWQAKQSFAKERQSRWFHWLERYGAKTMLLAWLPGIGDPLCTLGGWLRLPFWPSVATWPSASACATHHDLAAVVRPGRSVASDRPNDGLIWCI